MRYTLFVLTGFVFVLYSCGEYACSRAGLRFGLVGFSEADADTIIIKSFEKNNPGVMIDSVHLSGILFTRSNDTLDMVAFPATALLESRYDYQITFPGSAETLFVSGIEEEQRYLKKKGIFGSTKEGCENRVMAYRLNGQLKTVPRFNDTYFSR